MIACLYSLAIIASSFLYINEPVVNMREGPSVHSQVVSQAVFAEQVIVDKECSDWVAITTTDGYHGWVPSDVITVRQQPYGPSIAVCRLSAHIYDRPNVKYGPIKTVPFGTLLEAELVGNDSWIRVYLPDRKQGYIRRGDITVQQQVITKDDLVALSQKFLGVPYTWGGRSSFGYDCSGFVQMLYKHIGVHLPRDSAQQIKDKRMKLISIEEINPGDLLFFGPSAKEIKHVGMYIANGKFIHALSQENNPWISVNSLSEDTWSGGVTSHYSYRVAATCNTIESSLGLD